MQLAQHPRLPSTPLLHLPDLALPLSLLSHLLDCLFALAERSHNTVVERSDGCWGGGIRCVINYLSCRCYGG